jgi:hypothetical protein
MFTGDDNYRYSINFNGRRMRLLGSTSKERRTEIGYADFDERVLHVFEHLIGRLREAYAYYGASEG